MPQMQLISLCLVVIVELLRKRKVGLLLHQQVSFSRNTPLDLIIALTFRVYIHTMYVWNQKSRYLVKLTWLNFSSSVHTCMVIIDLTIQSSAKKRPGTGADTVWRPSCWITCFGIEDETAILSRYLYLYYIPIYYPELIYRHLYNFQCTIHR